MKWLLLVMLVGTATVVLGNEESEEKRVEPRPENIRVTLDYPLKEAPISHVLTYLRLQLKMAINVEDITRDSDSPTFLRGPNISVPKLKTATLKDCLDLLVRESGNRFAWSYDRGTVNVIAKPLVGIEDYPLDTTVKDFAFNGRIGDLFDKIRETDNRLRVFFAANSPKDAESLLNRQCQFHAKNETLRQILNTFCMHTGLKWESRLKSDGTISVTVELLEFEPLRLSKKVERSNGTQESKPKAGTTPTQQATEDGTRLILVGAIVAVMLFGLLIFLLLRRRGK